ncbi:CDGSH iron-sulfur domain-containing protein [Aeromicrobium fastidiosum]|uniref:CDGSH iron-sulfur domain-containing protein n=1 Tax=Aeromicrobium fastidiosum TaxID=52699 RepID=UPI00202347E8|nr:CDGSH iron-sulfur domain-containing protein [Aeromicrobium fastidiosum]MCL8251961.1 CDGSH iron-sulfur domain-containing protein [Aeromicrobium fastidiosum]
MSDDERGREHPTVILCAGGPMLLRGDHVIEDADGVRHRTTRPVSAVCRCGKSSMQPWCDGTHKLIPDKSRP